MNDLDYAMDEIAELQNALAHVLAVERDGAHIPIEWHEVGGVRIGLDGSGNAVRVEFPDDLPGWVAE